MSGTVLQKSVPDDEPLVAGSPPEEDDTGYEEDQIPCIIRYITLISRLWGVITITGIVYPKSI